MEILSPSSNMKHIEVAIDNKANAVYGGLKNWNARNKAINFSDEEYNYLIEELHKNNIKFFLTLNILMLDEEINDVIVFLKNNKLPDAFIVADIGLITELQKEFPEIPIHLSTQFGCHSIDDVAFAKSLNSERAVLARELTLSEINKIKENTDIELECFIWGSQCLSFSGLCFFGTLINGGGGNRGKCIITCRDIYSIDGEKGHYFYVPDMDCINLISKLDGIDCLKLEGRRRDPNEIKTILKQINNKIESKRNSGYLLGTNIKDNSLYEKINSRTKPVMMASMLSNINNKDICLEYKDGIPINFSKNYNDPNVMYVYTEIKKDYKVNKKNLSLELILENNNVKEILYINHKGTGHTFFGTDENLIELYINQLIEDIESKNSNINIYKIKYKRVDDNKILINKSMYLEIIDYILNDCKQINFIHKNNKIEFKQIYLETKFLNVIDEFVNDRFIKIIYDISSMENLKNLKFIIDKYGDKIVYKLPLFNWKSENLEPYLKLLENKEVMFTRLTQIYLCKNLKFKKKYTDYTIYVWNKRALDFLEDNAIDEFTASFELSYRTNKTIFGNNPMQVILCGKLPMVYTRNCFSHLFGCVNCKKNQNNCKNIKNSDKNINFEIMCNSDYRYVLNREPILNDYSKFDITDQTTFRYVSLGQDVESIKRTIECLKGNDYYNELLKQNYWQNSYECNLIEGKE